MTSIYRRTSKANFIEVNSSHSRLPCVQRCSIDNRVFSLWREIFAGEMSRIRRRTIVSLVTFDSCRSRSCASVRGKCVLSVRPTANIRCVAHASRLFPCEHDRCLFSTSLAHDGTRTRFYRCFLVRMSDHRQNVERRHSSSSDHGSLRRKWLRQNSTVRTNVIGSSTNISSPRRTSE
jgi:hypothetical protein